MGAAANLVRTLDRDRYLAALLAHEPARSHLLALYAVDLELSSISRKVSEPLVGEMRLQWWHDALTALVDGRSSGNPVADALLPAIEAGKLPLSAFTQIIDAHRSDAYGEMLRSDEDLSAYCGAVFGIPIQLSCLILSGGRDLASGTASGHAGVVAGLLWVLENLYADAARGRIYLPGDLLARHGIAPEQLLQDTLESRSAAALAELDARAIARLSELNMALDGLDPVLRPAFAHLATVRSRLRAVKMLHKPGWFARGPSPLRRQWQIWRFSRTGRL